MNLDDMNYYGDRRVVAGMRGSWYDQFEEATMTAFIEDLCEDDFDEGFLDGFGAAFDKEAGILQVHCQFEVCDTCGGRGKHVNPSIDAGGIGSDDDFWDDDYDDETGESRYMRGDYDVPCYECHGKRVTPVLCEHTNSEAVLKYVRSRIRDEIADAAERAAERRYGY